MASPGNQHCASCISTLSLTTINIIVAVRTRVYLIRAAATTAGLS